MIYFFLGKFRVFSFVSSDVALKGISGFCILVGVVRVENLRLSFKGKGKG